MEIITDPSVQNGSLSHGGGELVAFASASRRRDETVCPLSCRKQAAALRLFQEVPTGTFKNKISPFFPDCFCRVRFRFLSHILCDNESQGSNVSVGD